MIKNPIIVALIALVVGAGVAIVLHEPPATEVETEEENTLPADPEPEVADDPDPDLEIEEPAGPTFVEVGNLTRDTPGSPAGVWYLVYEAPGSPALRAALQFTEASECVADGVSSDCDLGEAVEGARVEVTGAAEGDDEVVVQTLRYLDEQ